MIIDHTGRKVIIEKEKKTRIKTRNAHTKSGRRRFECYTNIQLQNEHPKFNDNQPLNRLHVAFLFLYLYHSFESIVVSQSEFCLRVSLCILDVVDCAGERPV